MTGYDIYKNALLLLNVQEENGGYKDSVPPVAIAAVNEIGNDLFGDFYIDNIFTEIAQKGEVLSAFINGVAMVLSASFNMYNQNAYFTTVYNQKRAIIKNQSTTVKNNIPYVSGEVI